MPEYLSKAVVKSSYPDFGKQAARRLKGDMDNIVEKTLSKEPEHRYPSVQTLMEDIQRHLNGLPVLARKNTLFYRGEKFFRRKKWSLLAIVLLSVIFLFAFILDRHRLQQISAEHQQVAKQTLQVSHFLSELFAVSNDNTDESQLKVMKVILQRGKARLQSQFLEAPQTRAELMHKLGLIYQQMGLYPDALSLFQQCLSVYREQLPDQQEGLAGALNSVGVAYNFMGEYEKAILLLTESLTITQTIYQENNLEIAGVLDNLGAAYRHLGRNEEALRYFYQAENILKQTYKDDNYSLGITYNHMGLSQLALANTDLAINYFMQALSIFINIRPADHPDIAISEGNLAKAYRARGDYERAAELLKHSLSIFKKRYGESHPHVATAQVYLARSYHDAGMVGQAIPLLQKALTIRQNIYGEHALIAEVWHHLGLIFLTQKNSLKAAEALGNAHSIRKQKLGIDHPDTKLSQEALLRAENQIGENQIGQPLTKSEAKKKDTAPNATQL